MFEHTEILRKIRDLKTKRVKYPQYVQACKRLSDFITLSECGDATLLMGESGVGKTVTAETVYDACKQVYVSDDPKHMPVVKCRLPSSTGTKSLLEVVLEAVKYPFITSATKETVLSRIVREAYAERGVRVLFIDEMQRAKHSDKRTRIQEVANAFTSLIDELGIAVVMVGTEDMQNFTQQFEPFRRRALKRVVLRPFDMDTSAGRQDVRNFVGTLAQHLPAPIDGALVQEEGLTFLEKTTSGKVGVINELLRIAAAEEVRVCDGVPNIISFARIREAADGMDVSRTLAN